MGGWDGEGEVEGGEGSDLPLTWQKSKNSSIEMHPLRSASNIDANLAQCSGVMGFGSHALQGGGGEGAG